MTDTVGSSVLLVNRVWTTVLTIGGQGISSRPHRVIIIFPGNPGMPGFYQGFMTKLFFKLEVPVWCVFHAGHDAFGDPTTGVNLKVREASSLYDLQGQIQHKIDFIRTYLRPKTRVTLLGHSIGCRIALEVMRHFVDAQEMELSMEGYLLFPMMERMYQTPSGLSTWILTAYLSEVVCFFAWFVTVAMSDSTRQCLVEFLTSSDDDECVKAACRLVHPERVRNVLYLAYTELLEVNELDYKTLRILKDRVRLYYGSIDAWCPIQYFEDLKTHVPDIRAQLCSEKIPHAFVLQTRDAEIMADVVSWWYANDHSQ